MNGNTVMDLVNMPSKNDDRHAIVAINFLYEHTPSIRCLYNTRYEFIDGNKTLSCEHLMIKL